jgi:hypothetical protein
MIFGQKSVHAIVLAKSINFWYRDWNINLRVNFLNTIQNFRKFLVGLGIIIIIIIIIVVVVVTGIYAI